MGKKEYFFDFCVSELEALYLHFATCERDRALGFIKKGYPSRVIEDTPECAGPLLDLVEQDVVRIQDPMMHGNNIEVLPATNFQESLREQIVAACRLVASAPARQEKENQCNDTRK